MTTNEPIKIVFNPKTGRYKRGKYESRYSGNIIQQKKQCPSCPHFREAKVVSIKSAPPSIQVTLSYCSEVASSKNDSIKKSPEEKDSITEDKLFGICVWSVYWKVLYKVEKPRKCSKISS
ncbi:hypothetical protein KJA16_01290 [Patescibacteria group bacterium]|nr:hypothetical protein [Patescibacteria group bacterium]